MLGYSMYCMMCGKKLEFDTQRVCSLQCFKDAVVFEKVNYNAGILIDVED